MAKAIRGKFKEISERGGQPELGPTDPGRAGVLERAMDIRGLGSMGALDPLLRKEDEQTVELKKQTAALVRMESGGGLG